MSALRLHCAIACKVEQYEKTNFKNFGLLVYEVGSIALGGVGINDTAVSRLKGEYSGNNCTSKAVSPYTGQTVYLSATKLRPAYN